MNPKCGLVRVECGVGNRHHDGTITATRQQDDKLLRSVRFTRAAVVLYSSTAKNFNRSYEKVTVIFTY